MFEPHNTSLKDNIDNGTVMDKSKAQMFFSLQISVQVLATCSNCYVEEILKLNTMLEQAQYKGDYHSHVQKIRTLSIYQSRTL